MPLAGQMRLKTFLAFAVPVLAGALIAGGFWIRGELQERAALAAQRDAERAVQIQIEQKRQSEEAEVRRVAAEAAAVERRAAEAVRAEERQLAAAAEAAARSEREAAVAHLAPHERSLLRDWAGKDLGTKKKKDVSAGKPWKINLYQDAGHRTVSRAKVDLDRDTPDSKWDEKWTFADGVITRKRSTRDDDTYDIEETFDGSNFVAN